MRPARGMSTLYPMVPTLWPILEKTQKILNKKQTLSIGENVSLLNSETKEVNLRFVSSSAPTLRSALHFWKYYQVLKSFKIAEDFLFHVKRNWFFSTWKKDAFREPALLMEPAKEKSLPAYLKCSIWWLSLRGCFHLRKLSPEQKHLRPSLLVSALSSSLTNYQKSLTNLMTFSRANSTGAHLMGNAQSRS